MLDISRRELSANLGSFPWGSFSSQLPLGEAELGRWRGPPPGSGEGKVRRRRDRGGDVPQRERNVGVPPPRRTGTFADKIKRKSESHYKFINI